ncbi:MAG: hypothetical protein AVDCRST_MAG56-7664 [uncultured Cytophagales bacterium]|uniref:Uncharacterized protein n=1 Tax=uncultured Cytophagales bacterium TaxID=158755 RepID=A0A6J4LNB9_9SPHI|nr:MAG: hypothetical protein AVDCRST_MAG56-7664 [uncultured Cytophagales bacterium]
MYIVLELFINYKFNNIPIKGLFRIKATGRGLFFWMLPFEMGMECGEAMPNIRAIA